MLIAGCVRNQVAGASVEDGGTCGWQPLNLALVGGEPNLGIVQLLLDAGANVEAAPGPMASQTPLLLCAAAQLERCMHALLDKGAQVHVTTSVRIYAKTG